jgi:2-polyprenyl-3-methyl-5-hydroxy-6-metoxy-1,4-benzoquinol methylase
MKTRDYAAESIDNSGRKYVYNFDFDVMHGYFIRSFSPYFRGGKVLELGSFRGDFTRRLEQYFSSVTCVEASENEVHFAAERAGSGTRIIHGEIESVHIEETFGTIVCTHVLEHLDEPVVALQRARHWLDDDGVLIVACPNAHAASRQIAVKMGLVSHATAVTEAERLHGHRATYCLESLETIAKSAGLRVVRRGGVFFKALANFQWDMMIENGIVSKEYLDGCYELGEIYPDLSATIYLVCMRP